MRIHSDFTFEAAHQLRHLPAGHKCRRMHGHHYRVRLVVAGAVDPKMGWVCDFATLGHAFKPLWKRLDHHCLNDLPGLAKPTAENLAMWLWRRLVKPLPGLVEIHVWETEKAGCVYAGEHEAGRRP